MPALEKGIWGPSPPYRHWRASGCQRECDPKKECTSQASSQHLLWGEKLMWQINTMNQLPEIGPRYRDIKDWGTSMYRMYSFQSLTLAWTWLLSSECSGAAKFWQISSRKGKIMLLIVYIPQYIQDNPLTCLVVIISASSEKPELSANRWGDCPRHHVDHKQGLHSEQLQQVLTAPCFLNILCPA